MGGPVALGLHGLRTDLEGIMSRALGTAALTAKKDMTAVARRMSGDGRLSGVGRRGARIGANFDYTRGSRGLSVAVYANGPWQLVEYGRSGGYRIPKRRGTGPNKSRRGAPRMHLRTGGPANSAGKVTGRAVCPFAGGRVGGKRGWTNAYPAVMDGMGDELAEGLIKALERW